jgi:hypothetical protein
MRVVYTSPCGVLMNNLLHSLRYLSRCHSFQLPSVLYPVFLAILLVTRNIGGMETTGEIRQIEVTETSLFY